MTRLIPVKCYHIDTEAKVICSSHRMQSHRLLQHGSIPWCTVLQELPSLQFSTVGHRFFQKTCGMGCSPWFTAHIRNLLLHGISIDCVFPQGTWTFSGSPEGCGMDALHNGPSWAASTDFTMIFSTSCNGTWTYLLPFIDLGASPVVSLTFSFLK